MSLSEESVETPPQGAPESSSVSMKSEKTGLLSDEAPQSKRPDSPVPSCVSMKSDRSMWEPIKFNSKPTHCQTRSQSQRPDSPVFSCVSMKSDRSMWEPIKFNSKPTHCHTRPQSHKALCPESHRATSPVPSSPPCGKTCRTLPPLLDTNSVEQNQHRPTRNSGQNDEVLQRVKTNHKASLKRRFQHISEGIIKPGAEILLSKVYTELHMSQGHSEGVNKEHEVWQVETASRSQTIEDITINCNDIFKPIPGQEKHIRTVMTKGVAGIGKTISVQKFILDWTDGVANQDVDFMFPLPFRELNLVRGDQYSLHGLLLDFFPELKELKDSEEYRDCLVLFIFDGLDESRLPLNFQQKAMLYDVREISSVDVVMMSVIQGTLLPSALIWITSRPAATSQIPVQYIDQLTEIRGFSDPQKKEYFRRRISDESQANRIISHIKASRSLHIMCHIPVFCWIAATVLQQLLEQDSTQEIPKTLTEMFIHFLVSQAVRAYQKYQREKDTVLQKLLKSQKNTILKLAELAFKNLENSNLMFYEEDLRECGIDVSEPSVYSSMCTEIFREESVFHQKKVYCFVHLSIQEFLAAVFVFQSYVTGKSEPLELFLREAHWDTCFLSPLTSLSCVPQYHHLPLHVLLKSAIDKALESTNGHLDLFLRFLMGISLESNQKRLQGLLKSTHHSSKTTNKTRQYIKELNREGLSPERCINLFHCLHEMNDLSMSKEIQEYLKSPKDAISPAHCSALAHMLLMSEEVLDEFDLKKYNTTDEGRRRLLPAVRCFSKAKLAGCNLTGPSLQHLASVLQSSNSLTLLDLSFNNLQLPEVQHLYAGLGHHRCRLQTLRLACCGLNNRCCEIVASVLQSPNCLLTELDMSHNDLGDSGVQFLSAGLSSPHCKLQTLRIADCLISEEGCVCLASSLTSNPSHLEELDLRFNHPGESGLEVLSVQLADPHYRLERLKTDQAAESSTRLGLLRHACKLTLDPNTIGPYLALSEGNRKVFCVVEEQPYPNHPERFDWWDQVLCREGLSGRCYWEVEWSGKEADIAVTYRSIQRKGRIGSGLGWYEKSWCLECSKSTYHLWHNSEGTDIPVCPNGHSRIGVYLNWPAGTLSFYSISSDTLIHLHTFYSTFSEPLYPGFYVDNSSVSLCQIT